MIYLNKYIGKGEDIMYCSKCGKPNPENARFCASCGEPMVTEAPAQTASTEVTPETAPEIASEVAPEAVQPEAAVTGEGKPEVGFMPEQSFPGNYAELFARPEPKKRKTGVIILCIVLAVALVAGGIAAAFFIINAPVISDDEIDGEWTMEVGLGYMFHESLSENEEELNAQEEKLMKFFAGIDSEAKINLNYNFNSNNGKVTLSISESDVKQAYTVFFDDLSAYINKVGLYQFAEESGLYTHDDIYTLRQYYSDTKIINMIMSALRSSVSNTDFDEEDLNENGYFLVEKDRLYFSEDKDDPYEDGCWLIEYDGKDVITIVASKDFEGISLDGKKLVRVD